MSETQVNGKMVFLAMHLCSFIFTIRLTLSKVKQGTHQSDNKHKKFYMHCKTGGRSLLATSIASRMGFKDVTNIAGGFDQIKSVNVNTSPPSKDPVATL